MAVVLAKGGSISLVKQAQKALTTVTIGLGWETPAGAPPADLDLSVLAVDASNRSVGDAYFIFYGNLATPDNSIMHTGDDRTGTVSQGDDDEMIVVNLQALPANVEGVRVFVTTYTEGNGPTQTFGRLEEAFVRIVDNDTHQELARYNLVEDASNAHAMLFAELRRNGGDWDFRAIGEQNAGGLAGLLGDHGVRVA